MKKQTLLIIPTLLLFPLIASASTVNAVPVIAGIRLEFILFALTLIGVAVFHNKTMYVALGGLVAILAVKFGLDAHFNFHEHILGSATREGEWHILTNLLGLLFGFGILAKHFEDSNISNILPKYLPDDWKGGFVLLFFIMILATFLDSIASALIGGAIAHVIYRGKVHLGYLVAIVAASNAGGAGSVLGNMPTTMMWIDGVSPFDVAHAFIGSISAFLVFAIPASIIQQKYHPIQKHASKKAKVDHKKAIVIIMILLGAIFSNALIDFPAIGVWIAILIGALFTTTPWKEIKHSWQGTVFLLALVTCASLMPVEDLPVASWQSALSLGFVSAVFDNIPLTKLCLDQGGYDWGMLAYTVGFGGSMIWFGSSAGVALSNMFPEMRSVWKYIKEGWYVIVAYIIGFFIMLAVVGWNPHAPHRKNRNTPTIEIPKEQQLEPVLVDTTNLSV